MSIFVQIVLNIIITASIYSIISIGFNLIYSSIKSFDMSYGSLAVLGGYFVLLFYKMLNYDLALSIILSLLLTGFIGFLIDFFIYRKLRKNKASNAIFMITTIGVMTIIQSLIAIFFTNQFQSLSKDISSQKIFTIFGGSITEVQLTIFVVNILIIILTALVLKYSKFGKAVRAVSQNKDIAETLGINSNKVIGIVFFVGTLLGALGGIFVGFDTGLQPVLGFSLLLKIFVVIIIGGAGNIFYGLYGALILSIIENISVWYLSGEWRDVIAFAVLIIILILKPEGLFTKKKK